jgi:hypothetical protein
VWCTSFSGPIELRLHLALYGYSDPLVQLPDGTFVDGAGFQGELSQSALDWLYRPTPGQLFGQAAIWFLISPLCLGLVAGCAAGNRHRPDSPADVPHALDPLAGLHTDRATAVTLGVLVTFGIVALSIGLRIVDDPGGPVLPVSFGLLATVMTAWGWLLVSRLWLCGTGRLPWRLMAFLDDAHRRGVLRQVGAAYQFRHVRLQERLALKSADRSDLP